MSISIQYLFIFVFISSTNAWYGSGGLFDWIWFQSKDSRKDIGTSSPLISIPFESETDDEKFLKEAEKFTDIMKSSPLDSCQHKIVLKIKSSCSSMTEEELAKMSVNLLNCQSAVDGRQTFPCTDSMTLKQCTEKMNPTVWNAYHMMNNRAKAVCLAARQSQFHALSEMTVNKLMSAAHNQIEKMNAIVKSQDQLEKLTLGTINLIEKGNIVLLEHQDQLKSSQEEISDFISYNLNELVKEKALIAAGHKELAEMTHSIREKMDEAKVQLFEQAGERVEHHKRLLADIDSIQKLIKEIFLKIDSSTDQLLAQHTEAATKYEEAVENLVKINETVHYLLQVVGTTRSEIEEKFLWMQNFLDDAGIQFEKTLAIAYHIGYLLIGMLLASFLNISTLSRIVLVVVVPLNLFFAYIGRTDLALDYSQMTTALVATVVVIAVVNRLLRFSHHQSSIEYPSVYENEVKNARLNNPRRSNKWLSFRGSFDKIVSLFNNVLDLGSHWMGRSNDTDEDDGYLDNRILKRYEFYTSLGDSRCEVSSDSLVREWLQNKVPAVPSVASNSSSDFPRMCSAISQSSGQRCRRARVRGMDYCVSHKRNDFEIR